MLWDTVTGYNCCYYYYGWKNVSTRGERKRDSSHYSCAVNNTPMHVIVFVAIEEEKRLSGSS